MDAQRLSGSFFIVVTQPENLRERKNMKNTKKDVIAYRKTCPAKGTGLSHYILMDKKAK
jgi:modified peptide precursor CbpA